MKSFADVDPGDIFSPTYSIVNENRDPPTDFYRIESSEEILHLELPLYAENKNYF